jgi:hypothetical protein
VNCLDAVPTQFRAGDTVRWSRYVAEYLPSDGWTLAYRFTSAAGKFDVPTAEADPGYLATIAAGDSAAVTPGSYTWVEFVSGGDGERYTLRQGTCVVLPNLAAQEAGTDQRSQAQIAVDNITSFLAGTATQGVAEYEIHGRSIKYHTIADLQSLRNMFQSIVNQEKADRGEATPRRRVLTGFGGRC